ncbi:hypothetical protein SLEP1_g38454 [Rubroshorea leprosula]|nr:hypothetical protein SLEP1_g38454 [Rubroshorea leprosula]
MFESLKRHSFEISNVIGCVINFDFPIGIGDHVHRIGRIGRVDATGVAYTFLSKQDCERVPDLIKVLEGSFARRHCMAGLALVGTGVVWVASMLLMNGSDGHWNFGGRGGMRDDFGGRDGMRDGGFGIPGGRGDSFSGWGNKERRLATEEMLLIGVGIEVIYSRSFEKVHGIIVEVAAAVKVREGIGAVAIVLAGASLVVVVTTKFDFSQPQP